MAEIAGHKQSVVVNVVAICAVGAQERSRFVYRRSWREVCAVFPIRVRNHHAVLVPRPVRHVEARPVVRCGQGVAGIWCGPTFMHFLKMHFSRMHFSKMHFSKMHFSKMHLSKMHFSKILQIFGGLVLGCIKTKFCKKICVRQHFFKLYKICILLHRCNLKIFAKHRFEKSAIFVKFQQNFCKCCKICKILTNSKNFS